MKTLRFWALPNDGFRTLAGLADLLRDFHREHRDVRVQVRARTAGQAWSDLMLLSKRPHEVERPDVVQVPHTWTSSLAELDLLANLDELEAGPAPEAFHPAFQEHCRLQGTRHVYSLPWWAELRVLLYRPAALRAAKTDAALLGTWEGFREVCAALAKAKSLVPVGNGHPRRSFSLEDLAPRVWARGGDFFSRDGRRCIFQREEGVRGIADHLELWDKRWMPLPGGDGATPGTIGEGTAAMQFCGRVPADPQIAAAPMPDGGPTAAAGQHLAVVANSAHPREAAALVRYLLEPGRQEAYAASLRALPSTPAGVEKALSAAGRASDAFRLSLERARTLPSNPLMGTLERIFSRVADSLARRVLRGGYRPETLREEMVHAAAEMDYVFQLTA